MARTFVQQSQISGSLAYDDKLAAGSSLASKQTLVGDLNALRSQVNKIIGGSNWYDALSGSQDLADIYAAVHMSGTAADFQGSLDVTGVATFDSAITGSAGLKLAGDLDVNSTADFQGAVNLQDTLTVAQAADLNGSLDVAGQVDLAAAGVATNVRGTLSVTEVASFSAAITGSAGLKLAGDADFNSSADFQGAVNMQSTLDVAGKGYFAGIVDVDGTLSASVIKIDGDQPAGALYLVGAAGEIAEEGNLKYVGSLFQVTGSMGVSAGLNVASGGLTVAGDRLEVTGSFGLSGAAELASTLDVTGAATFDGGIDVNGSGITAASIKIDSDVTGRLYVVDGSGYISDEQYLNFAAGELSVTGSLKVTSSALVEGALNVDGAADFDSSADFAGAVVMQSSLDVDGAVDLDSTLDVAGNAMFRANVDVIGNLTVQGSMTYIETQNLKVRDAFIHLATGSTGAQSSGIVLHGGAGASDDIMLAQDAGGGEFVFAKVAQAEHGDVDGSNAITVNAAQLIPAWMSGLKVGALEGSLSGSFEAITTGSLLSSPADLLLSANGQAPISFIESGEYALFNAQFPGSSLVAAIVAAGGNFKQDSFKPGIKTAGVDSIDYSSVGTLRTTAYASTAAKKLAMDVYLNGVRLAYSDDYAIDGSGVLTLTMDTTVDDVLTVVIHNSLT